MKCFRALVPGFLVLSCLNAVASEISREELGEVATKYDILDLDYDAPFGNGDTALALTLDAKASFGGNITLHLRSNDELFDDGRPNGLDDDFFTGTVDGQKYTSAATVTVWRPGLTGRISLMGPNGRRQTILLDHLKDTSQTVLYNEKDALASKMPTFEHDALEYDQVFGRPAGPGPQFFDAGFGFNGGGEQTSTLKRRSQPAVEAAAATALDNRSNTVANRRFARRKKVLRVNKSCHVVVAADSSFMDRFRDKAVKKMTSIVAQVSQIFKRELGVKLTIKAAFVDEADNLGLGNTGTRRDGDVADVLKLFSAAVKRGQVEIGEDVCISHLFTSRNFGKQLGVAFVGNPDKEVQGGICSASAGVGVSTHIRSSGKPLETSAWVTTVAHEMGHGFGATHDESTRCEGSNDIMAAAVRSTEGSFVDDFSPCSVEAIRKVVESKGTCLR